MWIWKLPVFGRKSVVYHVRCFWHTYCININDSEIRGFPGVMKNLFFKEF